MTDIVTGGGIRVRDINMAAMIARMDALMAPLQTTSGVEPALGRQDPLEKRNLLLQTLGQQRLQTLKVD